MPPKNTHFPNYWYHPQHHALRSQHLTPLPHNSNMQASRYETPLLHVPWHHASLIQFPILPYQMSPYQRPPMPYKKPTYPVQNTKVVTQLHIRKNLFKVEKKHGKIYTPLTEPIGQLYEKLMMVRHIILINEIWMNARAWWI